MKQSESIAELASALSKAQGQIKPAKMDGTNPFFHSKYATLNSVWEVCRKPLADNGLSVVQSPIAPLGDLSAIGLTTRLFHSSGEYLEDTMYITMEASKNNAQAAGKIITYLRRYALSAMLGIVADEDTDANMPENSEPNGKSEPKASTNDQKLMAPAKFVQYLVNKLGYDNDNHVRATMGLLGFKAVPQDKAKRKLMYASLEVYRGFRKKGLSQDDALAALDGVKE